MTEFQSSQANKDHPSSRLTPALTEVQLLWDEGRLERWIRFGHASKDRSLDAQRRTLFFPAGAIFCFVRWQANDFGTVLSRVDILRACHPHEACTKIGLVYPGAEVLLRQTGWPKVEPVLQTIDTIERNGFDPADVCPDHWRHVHNRLSASQDPRAYSSERHALWLQRQKVQS
jgi:hypothetical protein